MSEFNGMLERHSGMDRLSEYWAKKDTTEEMMRAVYTDDEYLAPNERTDLEYDYSGKHYDSFGKKRTSGISVDDPDYMSERYL